MALSALSVVGTGCTGDDDDDDGSPGGSWGLTVDSSGEASGYAEFYESFEGDNSSLRDIPIGACIDPIANTGIPDPVIVYEDVGTSLTAVSGGTTVTYTETVGATISYTAAPQAGEDDASYTLSIDAEAQGDFSVPGLPSPIVTTAGTTLGWATMGADDAYVLASDVAGGVYRLCHVADNGSYDLAATVTATITSGFATVIGANYGEFSHTDGSVSVVTQAGNQFDTAAFTYFAVP